MSFGRKWKKPWTVPEEKIKGGEIQNSSICIGLVRREFPGGIIRTNWKRKTKGGSLTRILNFPRE